MSQVFYHSAPAAALDSIMANGLGGKGAMKRWDFSTGHVCIANNVASSKLYANDVAGLGYPFIEQWGDATHVLLEITGLDERLIERDPNSVNPGCFQYVGGPIPASNLKVVQRFKYYVQESVAG